MPDPKSWKRERGSNAFPARFDSECNACGWEIEEGDMIKYDANEEIVHEECP